MALSRRSGHRFQASIWPGFVDAMTGLLLVLMFVLTIFMVVQFALRETITGQASELDTLSTEIAELSRALGLEQDRSASLTDRVGALTATLGDARQRQNEQTALITSLTSSKAAADARIDDLETARDRLSLDKDALEQAMVGLRDQVEAEAGAAEALRAKLSDSQTELTAMTLALEEQRRRAEETLTLLAAARDSGADLEAKLAEALAVESQQSDEFLAMKAELAALKKDQKLSLEEVRERLAAALAAQLAAEAKANEQMSAAEERAALLSEARKTLSQQKTQSEEGLRARELLNQQVAALRNQLGQVQALLDDSREREAARDVRIDSLGQDLNAALARVAAEEKRRREIEQEKNELLEAEKQDLEKYRSEFFGRLRDVLGTQQGVRIEGDRFVFSSEVLFPPGQATLSDSGKNDIAKVAEILRKVVDDIPDEIDWIIRVDGHTDDAPLISTAEFADNWELSQARALSVVRYMIDFLGVPPDRLAANGFAQYQPIAPGSTAEARAQNRRIELKFTER